MKLELWRSLKMRLRLVLPLLVCIVVSCDGSETPTQIFQRLMQNYDRNEAPGYPDKRTDVRLGIYVTDIQYLGDDNTDFLITFYLRQSWNDPRLSFTAIDAKKSIQPPADSWKQIWIPDTFIRIARSVKLDDDMSSNRLLKLNSTGGVWYVTKLTAVIPSRINLESYPFGSQRVNLIFESFGQTQDILNITTLDPTVDVAQSLSLSQMTLHRTLVTDCSMNYTTGAYPCLEMTFVFERRSSSFILNFYLPSAIIVILSWMAFWIDLETSFPSRLTTSFFSMLALILLNAFSGQNSIQTRYTSPYNCWVITCFVMVTGALVQFAVVNILSRISSSGVRGLEFLKPPLASSKKAIEANEKQVAGSGGDGKRKILLVDWFSRIIFPAAFLLFNLIYWIGCRKEA